MGLIIQQRALQAAGGPAAGAFRLFGSAIKSLFEQIHRAMNSVVLNIAEGLMEMTPGRRGARFASGVRLGQRGASRVSNSQSPTDTYPHAKVKAVDIALDEVCAMSWRLSGR